MKSLHILTSLLFTGTLFLSTSNLVAMHENHDNTPKKNIKIIKEEILKNPLLVLEYSRAMLVEAKNKYLERFENKTDQQDLAFDITVYPSNMMHEPIKHIDHWINEIDRLVSLINNGKIEAVISENGIINYSDPFYEKIVQNAEKTLDLTLKKCKFLRSFL